FNLTHSEEPAVREAVGATMTCELAPGSVGPLDEGRDSSGGAFPPPSRADRLECEVLVIGSGAGGATAACKLAEAGLDVLILEAGGDHCHRHDDDAVMPSLARLYRDGGLTVAAGRPALPIP